jgi:hypothetical protein
MSPDREPLNPNTDRVKTLEAAMREIINQGQMFPYSAVAYRKIQAIAHKALKDKP